MSYALLIILWICSFVKKDSKVIVTLLFCYAIIIFGLNTNNPDLLNYLYHYKYSSGRSMEPIYTLLEHFFVMLGFDYTIFRVVLCAIGMLLLVKTFCDFSSYPAVLLSFYLLYPFSLDVVQVRTFIADAIIVFSIRYIVQYSQNGKKINIISFVLCVIVATGFHYSSIFFVVLLLGFTKMKAQFLILFFSVPVAALLLSNISFLNGVLKAITIFSDAIGYISRYHVVSSIQIFRLISTRGLLILMCWMWQKIIANRNNLFIEKNADKKIVAQYEEVRKENKVLFNCILYVAMYTIVEILFGGNFERINRVAIILSTLLITRQIKMARNTDRYLMWSVSVIAFGLYFFSEMLSKSTSNGIYFNSVFRVVFENNLIF